MNLDKKRKNERLENQKGIRASPPKSPGGWTKIRSQGKKDPSKSKLEGHLTGGSNQKI